MKYRNLHRILFGIVSLALFLPGAVSAQTQLEVNQDMLLWKKGFSYRTEVSAHISLTNSNIKMELEEEDGKRMAAGSQSRSFHYDGAMSYTTQIDRAFDVNGSARRYYEKCSVTKAEYDLIELKVEASRRQAVAAKLPEAVIAKLPSWLGGSLPKKWAPYVEVKEGNVEWAGGSYIIVRQKPGSPNLLDGGALELGFQSMGALSGKGLLMEWPRLKTVGKAMVALYPAERGTGADRGKFIKAGGSVSPMVKDVIGRESKLLYEAMLGSVASREDGDMWLVDGETLDAMVHPTVKGVFRGRAVVQAERVTNRSPDPKVGEMNGFKLKFVSRGSVDGISYETNLDFVVETVDGGTHRTRLIPEDGRFNGEIWLDSENQTVRYGELKVANTKYDGFLPKIGELNAKINLEADLNFTLIYIQSITPAEEE
ncbi:MAG: hypothetical protein JNK37_19965 [Verrucomicrobiales bacterium]|nr:hypothetical protein [Verrucomicrobiales bacterium]